MRSFVESTLRNQTLLGANVVNATPLLGESSMLGGTDVFTPTEKLGDWVGSGSGVPLSSGIVMSEGVVMSETGVTLLKFDMRGALKGEP